MASKKAPIAVAHGDGIGPEIMDATLHVLDAAGAELEIHNVEIGEKVYLRGQPAGIEPRTWETIRNTEAFLKAPITTPQGGGFKSLNVTVRASLGLYANIRPCVSYYPYVATKHPHMDVVIVRENEEDLYTGVEYRQSNDAYHALKTISYSGSQRIVRYAFEYAKAHGRKKVTCFTKDNILKMTDGLFHRVFEEIAKEYPTIENEHWIIDIGTAKLADTPEMFDVLVLPNLYGDILSDVAAQIAGSVGLAGSANIGHTGAMFEAIHGSAPRRAGQNVANPSGLMLGAVMMLDHIGQAAAATRMHNAWLKTIEDGIHTYDVYKEGISHQKVGTKEFANAVCNNMGKLPQKLHPVHYEEGHQRRIAKTQEKPSKKSVKALVGVDIFVQSEENAEAIHSKLSKLTNGQLSLTMIGNRGVKVWPDTMPETMCIDQWRCRFMAPKKGDTVTAAATVALLQRFSEANVDFIKTENLYTFDGTPGYTVAQNEQ